MINSMQQLFDIAVRGVLEQGACSFGANKEPLQESPSLHLKKKDNPLRI